MLRVISLVLILGLLASIGTSIAGMSQYYFAIVDDDNSKDFYYSNIYERDISKYKSQTADTESFVNSVKRGHKFYCPGCYSAGIIRGKTYDDAQNKIEQYKKIFKNKGRSIHHHSWSP